MTPTPPAAAPPTVDLEEGRRLLEKATPGPFSVEWDSCDCGGDYPCRHGTFPCKLVSEGKTTEKWPTLYPGQQFPVELVEAFGSEATCADAEWMEWILTNAPALLSRLSASEARVRELEALLRDLDDAIYLDDSARECVSDRDVLGRVSAALSVGGETGDWKGAEG